MVLLGKLPFSLPLKLPLKKAPLFTPEQVISMAVYIIFLMTIPAFLANEVRPWAVKLDGRVIAVVADQKAAQKVIDELLLEQREARGQAVHLAGQLSFTRAAKSDGPPVDPQTFRELLAGKVGLNIQAAAIVVNGEKKLVVADQETAERLLASLKEEYGGFFERVAFAEEVRIKPVNAGLQEILTFPDALSLIKKGTRELQTYTVKDGDTLWDIAEGCRMDLENLLAVNPGLSPGRLQAGQTINLSAHTPLINVVATGEVTVKEEIPFPVEEKEDQNLYKGQRKVVQKGRPGEKRVTYAVNYQNGLEKSRQAVSEEVLTAATPQVVAKGSRVLLASRSGESGRLARPVSGGVSSPFGNRGREFHAGIDLAAAAGAPVAAAESGRVVRAGWYGGYGKCVDIDHGGGVVTRYAHLSAIAVGAGAQVSRGQLIGRVGSTGYATGPHLHFEVIVNGRRVNPAQFL